MRAKQINVIAVWVGLALSLLALTVSTMSFFQVREVQRARVSVQMELQPVKEQYRVLGRLEISGTTDALDVTIKTFSAYGPPMQKDFLFTYDVDWERRKIQSKLGALSPSEIQRAIVTGSILRKQLEELHAKEESLYYIVRIDYHDIFGGTHYFLRCAELGRKRGNDLITYCGTDVDRV